MQIKAESTQIIRQKICQFAIFDFLHQELFSVCNNLANNLERVCNDIEKECYNTDDTRNALFN